MGVKNIIFDLGGVILEIDIPKTFSAFSALSGRSVEFLQKSFLETELFRKFETGGLSEPEFRDLVRSILEVPSLTDQQIDDAWNSLLLDIPSERVKLLTTLSKKYKIYLLSNTSSIHIEQINRILQESSGYQNLNQLFDEVFVSYELGVVKPDPSIYEKVLELAGIKAGESLFLDDNLANVEAARALNIKSIHVQKPVTILEYLTPYV